MKVLLINGSPRKEGNTHIALTEVANALENSGVKTQIISIGTKAVQGCIACNKCDELGRCAFNDELYNSVIELLKDADGVIIGSPVYYGGPNGSLCALLDRVFYSSHELLEYKPAAAVVVARRGGTTATFDRLNKYFGLYSMPIVSSQYWNNAHGLKKGDALQDAEGLQIMRTLGRNMAWLLKNIKTGNHPVPEAEPRQVTHYIR